MTLGRRNRRPGKVLVTEEDRDGRRRRHTLRSLLLRSLAVFVAIVVVGAVLTAYGVFRTDWNDVKRINVARDLGKHRPPVDPNALNILLIGSDSRAGPNKKFGAEVAGQRSDTVIVLHIAPGAHQVVVLSFPRDSVVPVLACDPEAGAPGQVAEAAGNVEQINATFAYGGPGCLWKTIEQTTGIHINDFIELTFTGFEHLINDIGGVSVCLPTAVDDPDSKLRLSAGRHHVRGAQALAFWRARYIGEGSDLQRIQRDQFLMASLLQGIDQSGLMHSPSEIFRVIQDVAGHGYVTTDTQLSPARLLTIAEDLRGLPPGAVQFIEIPTVAYPGNPLAWVQWAQPQASELFAAVARDTRLPSAKGTRQHGAVAPATVDSVSRGAINVSVLNGTTEPGLAASTATSLTSLGFHLAGAPGNATTPDYVSSVIEYGDRAGLRAARTLAQLISHVVLQRTPGLGAGTIQLILGSTFTALNVAGATPSPSTTPSAASQNLAAQYGGITGNVSICSDAGAFAGPDGNN